MHRNMGNLDRKIRGFVIGPVAIVAALVVGAGTVGGIILLAVAVIMVVTAAVGVLPAVRAVRIQDLPARGRRLTPATHRDGTRPEPA